jgi:hypothetical protein
MEEKLRGRQEGGREGRLYTRWSQRQQKTGGQSGGRLRFIGVTLEGARIGAA